MTRKPSKFKGATHVTYILLLQSTGIARNKRCHFLLQKVKRTIEDYIVICIYSLIFKLKAKGSGEGTTKDKCMMIRTSMH